MTEFRRLVSVFAVFAVISAFVAGATNYANSRVGDDLRVKIDTTTSWRVDTTYWYEITRGYYVEVTPERRLSQVETRRDTLGVAQIVKTAGCFEAWWWVRSSVGESSLRFVRYRLKRWCHPEDAQRMYVEDARRRRAEETATKFEGGRWCQPRLKEGRK